MYQSFLPLKAEYFLVCIHLIKFIHSSLDWHLGDFMYEFLNALVSQENEKYSIISLINGI